MNFILRIIILIWFTLINCYLFSPSNFWIVTQITASELKQSLFLEPYLFPREKLMFYKYLNQFHIYFEYGSGGSTHQAAKLGLKIYTVEVGSNWISRLKREIQRINSISSQKVDITYLFVDLQSTEKPTYDKFLQYVHMYDHKKYNADFIFIDGKYIKSCLVNIHRLKISSNTIIFIHDADENFRSGSIKLINKYFIVVEHCDRSYVLKKKIKGDSISDNELKEIEMKDYNFSSMHTRFVSSLRKNFSNFYEKYKNYDDFNIFFSPVKHVWFFWWQGIEKAPRIIKLCLAAIERNLPDGKITVITKENIFDVVKIPSYIYDCVNNESLTLTSFSDILRNSLLAQKGGLWIDSTIFTGKKIPSEIFDYPYYTIHFKDHYKYVVGKWCTFVTYSFQNNIVPKFSMELLFEYMKYNDHFINYFLLDFIMLYGYEYIPAFKRAVQSVPCNNRKVLKMLPRMNNKFSESQMNYLLDDSFFFKISWKIPLNETINNSKTIFGHLVDKYLGN